MRAANEKIYLVVLTALLLLAGCATSAKQESLAYAPTKPNDMTAPVSHNGAIYQDGFGLSLFEDRKARRVGDALTIVLVEKTAASKKASTNTAKAGDIKAGIPNLLGAPLSFNAPGRPGLDLALEAELNSDQKFKGEGDSSLSNSLNGRITVTVAEVLSNGYLVVRGEKQLNINQGDEYVRFSGIVRPADVRSDNTVVSTLVADAKITYVGDGVVADANGMGIIGRFFNKLWPF